MTSQDDTNTETDDEARLRDGKEADALAGLDAQLAALAVQESAGGQVDRQLAAIVDALPESVRVEVIQRFRDMQDEMADGRGVDQEELTPEMQAQQQLLEEREKRMMISQWLSEQTLKKIRRAFMLNPALFQRMVNIGEELNKKGVYFETRKTQITNAELGGVSLQAALANNKDIEKDTGRGA